MNEQGFSRERAISSMKVTVKSIDSEGYALSTYRIGLSSQQIYDLGLGLGTEVSGPPVARGLLKLLSSSRVVPSERATGSRIFVGFGNKVLSAGVYCAIGPKHLNGENESRLSLKLARDLGVSEKEEVVLYPISYNPINPRS